MSTEQQNWFENARFGCMIHFGLYSLLGGEWKGKRSDLMGEWIQSYFRIPCSEYEKLAKAFNPTFFDAEKWVETAAEAGMKYMVVTAKHHDGFALFHSKTDNFNVVDATPFGRDIIKELSYACRRAGMRFGLYYSQELDWREPDGGGYTADRLNCNCMSWTNDWDFADNSAKDYSRCFKKKIIPQVTELLNNYGDISTIWFDTPHTISYEQSEELYNLVKHYQPQCLINTRIGNGFGDYVSMGDNQVPLKNSTHLYESPATLNDTWGYKSFDDKWKSPEVVIDILSLLASKGANYLLNVGPDHLGRFPSKTTDILKEVGKWTDTAQRAIYYSQGSPFVAPPDSCSPVCDRDGALCFVINNPDETEFCCNGIKTPVTNAYLCGHEKNTLSFSQSWNGDVSMVSVKLPVSDKDICGRRRVLVLEGSKPMEVCGGIYEQNGCVKLASAEAKVSDGIEINELGAMCGFTGSGMSASWNFTTSEKGKFKVCIELVDPACLDEWVSGNEIELKINGKSYSKVLTADEELADILKKYNSGAVSVIDEVDIDKCENNTLEIIAKSFDGKSVYGNSITEIRLLRI